jgi:hypothetical protein
MEATLALATIAQSWRLALVPGQTIEPQPKITLRPGNEIRVVPVPRGLTVSTNVGSANAGA